MVTGRTVLAGCTALLTLGCAAPEAQRPRDGAPERTYLGQRDDRPRPTVAPVRSAPATNCPAGSDAANGARLGELALFSRALFYLREQSPRDISPRSRQLLLAALGAIPAAASDVTVQPDPDAPPRWVTVTVKGERCLLNIEHVDAPPGVQSSLQEAMQFVGSRLLLPAEETQATFARIEMAASNGMLAALDRRAALLDGDSYRKVQRDRTSLSASDVASPEGQDARRPEFQGPHASEVAYLPLGGFPPGAGAEVEQAAKGAGGTPPKGVILDLRDNKGGLVEEAANVADVFIERGVLGWIVGRRERTALEAHGSGHDFTGAVVVLVNHQTAGAAELVASAIQGLGRGLIIGETTAGVGSVRSFFDLPASGRPPGASPDRDVVVQDLLDGGKTAPAVDQPAAVDPEAKEPFGLLVRTGYLRTANDHDIDGAGVRPDIELPGPIGAATPSADACLIQLAQALISQAPDGRRSTLLPIAKGLARTRDCGQAR